MCIGDWRLGKLVTVRVANTTLSIGATLDIPANPNRVGLMLAGTQASTTSAVKISTDGVFFDSMKSGEFLRLYTLQTHGLLPTLAIRVTGAAASAAEVGVTEFFMPAEYIQTALESYRSEYGQFLSQWKP